MRKLFSAAVFLAAFVGTAAAQDAKPALDLTVRPSGYEAEGSETRQRQERLLKRMQEDEFLFRNICIQCGGGVDKPGANAPFDPVGALGRRAPVE